MSVKYLQLLNNEGKKYMEYIIQYDNDKYLTYKFNLTDDIGRAARFKSIKLAGDFVLANLPKEFMEYKNKFKAIRIQVIKPEENHDETQVEENNEISKNKKEVDTTDNSSANIKKDLIDLNIDPNNLIKSKDFLEMQAIEINKRIEKWCHFIEITDIEQDMAVETIQLLKSILIKRHKINHYLEIIKSIEEEEKSQEN